MDGQAEWQVKIESNAKEIADKVENLKAALNELKARNHTVEIDIDKKKVDAALENINKMLSNISNHSGNIKSFTGMIRQINKAQKALSELEKSFDNIDDSSVNKFKKLLSPIRDLSNSIKNLNGTIKGLQKSFEGFSGRASSEIKKVKKATDELERSGKKSSGNAEKGSIDSLKSYASKIKKLRDIQKQYSSKPRPENQGDNYKKKLADLDSAIKNFSLQYDQFKTKDIVSKEQLQDLDALQKKAMEAADAIKLLTASQKGSSPLSRTKLTNQISEYMHNNSGMTKEFRGELQALINELSFRGASANVEDLATRFNGLKVSIREAGKEGRSFTDIAKDKAWYGLAAAIGTYFGVEDIINLFREASDVVIDINTSFTDLAKVSDATIEQLYDDFGSYAELAKDVGGTISDTIDATAAWSKNGYNIPDSKELAEVSMIYKNVGDGIDIDAANESLISTIKGFRMEAEDAMHVIDVFNEVSNNEAISSSGIGEALQRSAASFNAANTSLEKSVALVTATNTVLQNTAKTGNMWRTVSARLRGAETELVEMGEDTDGLIKSTSKLQSLIKGMTGFDIMESDGKTFKDIYEIVLGIGKEWENLSDIDQAALLEALAGKQQSNALAAALSNIDVLEKSYKEAMNAEGSAMREQEKYQQSIQYSIDRTKASLEELANDFLSSDFLKDAIDSADKLINLLDGIIDRIGSVPTLFAAISGGLSAFKNVGRDKMYSLILNMPTAC